MSAIPIRILVVDDEPPIRKLLRMGLGTQGYQVVEAPDGRTALERLTDKPDLIILDLGLPDMKGLELLDRLREITDGLKAGERVIVNGLQQVRPGVSVEPNLVDMPTSTVAKAKPTARPATVVAKP